MTHLLYLYALICFCSLIYVVFCLRQMNPYRKKLPIVLVLIGLVWAAINTVLSWLDVQNLIPDAVFDLSWLGAAIWAKFALCALVKKYAEDGR